MQKKLFKLLEKKQLNISCFESASAGYIAYRLAQSKYSGNIFVGSIVCYDAKIKENFLKVDHKLIQKYTPESKQVTLELIKKGKKIIKSDIYISCTGLLRAGGSENKKKPIGTFFYSIFYKNKIYNFRVTLKGKPKIKLKKLFQNICKSLYLIITPNKC